MFEVNLFLVAKCTSCGCRTFAYIFLRVIFFSVSSQEIFLMYNVLISNNKEVVQQNSYFTATQI